LGLSKKCHFALKNALFPAFSPEQKENSSPTLGEAAIPVGARWFAKNVRGAVDLIVHRTPFASASLAPVCLNS
jgi:hypothetical protein